MVVQTTAAEIGEQPEPDVRVCFIGDSFVAGVGDARHLGWAGRLAAHSHAQGQALTSYNLGIRRDTSADILRRFQAECTPRLPSGSHAGVVLSFGVNDTMFESGASRVATGASLSHLRELLTQLGKSGWSVLMASPPAVDDDTHNERVIVLDALLEAECARHSVPYVSVVKQMQGHDIWRREVREGDGPIQDPEATKHWPRCCSLPGTAGLLPCGADRPAARHCGPSVEGLAMFRRTGHHAAVRDPTRFTLHPNSSRRTHSSPTLHPQELPSRRGFPCGRARVALWRLDFR